MSYRQYVVLILILGAVLRLSFLNSVPNGLHYTESTLGFRAQNILNFGKDEYGRTLPFIFANWQEIEMPLPTYLSMPFMAISQKSIFFLRLPFALMGLLSVLGAILLTKKLFPEKSSLSLFVGLLIAVNPWGVWLSRMVNPEIVSFCFLIWGLYFILYKNRYSYIGGLLILLSLFSAKDLVLFIVPFSFVLIFWVKDVKKLLPVYLGVIAVLILIYVIPGFLTSLRDNDFSVFNQDSTLSNINLLRGQNLALGVPSIVGGIFFNKLFFLTLILKNFLSYFNPGYIFAKGDGNPLNGVSNFGPLFLTLFPVFVFGLYKIFNQNEKNIKLIFVWFLLAIIPGLFIANTPDTRRFIMALYPVSVLIAFGFIYLNKKVLTAALILLFLNLAVVSTDVLNKENSRSVKIFHPESISLAYKLNDLLGKNLMMVPHDQKVEKVWLTDNIDPNPGPLVGFLSKAPYSLTNLIENHGNIYKGWISQIGDITIGNMNVLKEKPEVFDVVIKSDKQNEIYKCSNLREEIWGGDDSKYQLIERCLQKNI